MRHACLGFVLLLSACPTTPDTSRAAGDRTPLSAACGALDDTRCLLPWPSNEYTVKRAASATGLQVSIDWHSLPLVDRPDSLNRLDGFSVATPLAVGFPKPLAPSLDGKKSAPEVRLFVAQPGLEGEIPVRLKVVNDDDGSAGMLIGYPHRPLAYATDYVAIATDDVTAEDGSRFEAPAKVKLALGLTPPTTDEERALVDYHAPARAVLTGAGVDLSKVIRLWDFTTRSADGVSSYLRTMRDAAIAAEQADALTVEVTSATPIAAGQALEVRGAVSGLPSFLSPDAGLVLDDAGLPAQQGTHTQPFRAVVPAGTGAYPIVIYGHGTGGTVNDDTFDAEIVAAGAGKLNLQWDGWTDVSTVNTLLSFNKVYSGTWASTGRLLQSLADAAALEKSLDHALGAVLASAELAGQPNPAAGRTIDTSTLVYAGGSLGGTMGYVLSLSDPSIHYAVLNVPGAAWTHFAPGSELWNTLDVVFKASTPSAIDRLLAVSMTQGSWDPVDGAAWAPLAGRTDLLLLEQMSMGDPILPNIGSDFLASSSGAVQLGAVLSPIVGVEAVTGPQTRTAITQFRVPSNLMGLSIHGFAAGGSPAGVAAREQISAFITSVWAGSPVIDVPPSCQSRGGTCDFSN